MMGDLASSEVSSSSSASGANHGHSNHHLQNHNGHGLSPVPSIGSSDIGEVDIEFWDVDVNEQNNNHAHGLSLRVPRLSSNNNIVHCKLPFISYLIYFI